MSRTTEDPRLNLRNPVHLLASGLGAGASPMAPGTLGTLIAIPLYLLVMTLPLFAYLSLTVLLFLIGIGICQRVSEDLGVKDHPGIVWDEIVGFLVAMTAAPTGWIWLFLGFMLFRFFDIFKPWPIRQVDRRLSGGLGVMLDDVLAGLYAFAGLQLAGIGSIYVSGS